MIKSVIKSAIKSYQSSIKSVSGQFWVFLGHSQNIFSQKRFKMYQSTRYDSNHVQNIPKPYISQEKC